MKPTIEQLRKFFSGEIKNPQMREILGTKTKHGTNASVIKWMKRYYKNNDISL